MSFRDQLLATLRAAQVMLRQEGVLVVGSQVPNLLQPEAASTLVVSRDVDIGIPVATLPAAKSVLGQLKGFRQSSEEGSVWIPDSAGLLEVNFVGMDSAIQGADETYLLEDPSLPLVVFGPLSLLKTAGYVSVEDLRVPVPRLADLMLEKLVTERTGLKGDRDLLVALGLLILAGDPDLEDLSAQYAGLPAELRHAVRSNLVVLSLMGHQAGMPDPRNHRSRLLQLLGRLERASEGET